MCYSLPHCAGAARLWSRRAVSAGKGVTSPCGPSGRPLGAPSPASLREQSLSPSSCPVTTEKLAWLLGCRPPSMSKTCGALKKFRQRFHDLASGLLHDLALRLAVQLLELYLRLLPVRVGHKPAEAPGDIVVLGHGCLAPLHVALAMLPYFGHCLRPELPESQPRHPGARTSP